MLKKITLAKSIEYIGLLQPIVVDTENNLLAGFHRLTACRCMKKWKEIERYLLRGQTRKKYKTYCVIVEPLEYDIKMYMKEKELMKIKKL